MLGPGVDLCALSNAADSCLAQAGVEEREVVVDRNNLLQRWTTFLVFAASQVSCEPSIAQPAAASIAVLARSTSDAQ